MFFAPELLLRRLGPITGIAWIAATRGIKHIAKRDIKSCDVTRLCEIIRNFLNSNSKKAEERLSLVLATRLLSGTVIIYTQQTTYFCEDVNSFLSTTSKRPELPSSETSASTDVPPILTKKPKRKLKAITPSETPSPVPHGEVIQQVEDVVLVAPTDITSKEITPLIPVQKEIENFGPISDGDLSIPIPGFAEEVPHSTIPKVTVEEPVPPSATPKKKKLSGVSDDEHVRKKTRKISKEGEPEVEPVTLHVADEPQPEELAAQPEELAAQPEELAAQPVELAAPEKEALPIYPPGEVDRISRAFIDIRHTRVVKVDRCNIKDKEKCDLLKLTDQLDQITESNDVPVTDDVNTILTVDVEELLDVQRHMTRSKTSIRKTIGEPLSPEKTVEISPLPLPLPSASTEIAGSSTVDIVGPDEPLFIMPSIDQIPDSTTVEEIRYDQVPEPPVFFWEPKLKDIEQSKRRNKIVKIIKRWKPDLQGDITIEHVCENAWGKPLNRFKIATIFGDLLALCASKYVILIGHPETCALTTIEKGPKLIRLGEVI